MATLLGSWVAAGTSNNSTLAISVTGDAPAGSRLVLAVNKSSTTTNGVSSITDTRGNTYVKRAHSSRASTHDMAIYECLGHLVSGDTVTVTFSEVTTRKTAVLSAWSGLGAVNGDSGNASFGAAGTSVSANGSGTTESVTTTGSGLVIAAFSRATAATLTPASPVGIAEIATTITTAGSSDRGLTLAWYIAGSLTATGTLSASQGWAAASVALTNNVSAVAVPSYALGGAGGLVASCTVNKPTGTASGDLLVAIVNTSSASSTLTASGFTTAQIPSTGMWWCWKIAGGSEPSSYTFTRGTSPTAPIYALMMRVTGHDPAAPVDVYSGAWAANAVANASIDAPSATATAVGTVISVATRANDVAPTVTPPPGMSTMFVNDTSHANMAGYAALLPVSAGATGAKTWGFGGSGTTAGYAVGNIVIKALPAAVSIEAGVSAESDSGLAARLDRSLLAGTSTETDAALTPSISSGGQVAGGVAMETETALVSKVSLVARASVATEADSAPPSILTAVLPAGLTSESDASLVARVNQGYTGLAIEVDSAAARVQDIIYASLALESDTALSGSTGAIVATGVASESEQALAASVARTVTAGIAPETDSSLAGKVNVTRGAGVASESDAVLSAVVRQSISTGVSLESDSALASARGFTVSTGVSIEADSGRPVAVAQAIHAGSTSELDSAIPAGIGRTVAVGTAQEADVAMVASSGGVIGAGVAYEADEGRTSSLALGALVATEVDAAVAGTPLSIIPAGVATESDTSLVTSVRQSISGGMATETDLARASTTSQIAYAGTALESEQAFPGSLRVLVSTGVAHESDVASSAMLTVALSAGVAHESDAGMPSGVTTGGSLAAGIALEANAALPGSVGSLLVVGVASETDEALGASLGTQVSVGFAGEVDEVPSASLSAQILAGTASEADFAAAFAGIAQRWNAGIASTVEIARSETGVQIISEGWWDGQSFRPMQFLGYWDGTQVRTDVQLLGYWDGSAIQPVEEGA